jgi:hypothetical protein
MQMRMRNSSNFEKIRNDSLDKGNKISPERAHLIKNLAIGSRSEYNSVRAANGFITSQNFHKSQNQKSLFQTVHTSYLAEPKVRKNKIVSTYSKKQTAFAKA